MARQHTRHGPAATAGRVPPGSRIAARLPGADFHDAWVVVPPADTAPPGTPVLDLVLAVLRQTPGWIDTCMVLRNRAVRPLGLKDLGRLSDLPAGKTAADYQPGERVGIFTLIEHSPDEVLLGDSDHHLDVVVSLHRQTRADDGAAVLTLSTVVHLKSRLGALYMLPVRPAHGLIARAMATALARPITPP
jgi:hypothetical protein